MNKMRAWQEEALDSTGLEGVSGLFFTPQDIPCDLVESAAGESEEPKGGQGDALEAKVGHCVLPKGEGVSERTEGRVALPMTHKELVEAQREDPELVPLLSRAVTSKEAE